MPVLMRVVIARRVERAASMSVHRFRFAMVTGR